MPLYFFNVRNGDYYNEDTEGLELPDVDTARKEAKDAAREMLAEQIALRVPVCGQTLEVTDEYGDILFTLSFKNIMHS
ncbi:hypothetical protein ASC96_29515 [Rhizobium sp. Root1204]|nr:hypothetical protein ASC96_29515 [Rhizobium sp. Root1204]